MATRGSAKKRNAENSKKTIHLAGVVIEDFIGEMDDVIDRLDHGLNGLYKKGFLQWEAPFINGSIYLPNHYFPNRYWAIFNESCIFYYSSWP